MLYSVHIIEELIQLTVGSNAEIITNSHWIEDLTEDLERNFTSAWKNQVEYELNSKKM